MSTLAEVDCFAIGMAWVALPGAPAGRGVGLAGDRVFSCSHERHTAALQSRVVVSAVFWDDSVLIREGRRCSAHHRCLAASRHKADGPPARRSRSPRGSAQGGTKESTGLRRQLAASPRAVPGDPSMAHRPGTAADHPPRRTRRGDAQPAAPGEAGQPDGYRPGARSQRTRVPAPILSTPAGSQDGTYTVRELVAGSRIRREGTPRKGVRLDGRFHSPSGRLPGRSPERRPRVALAAQQPAQRRSLGR
jgi:hypothetical protein